MRLEASEIAEFSFYKIILDEHHHRIKLTLKQMHAELHDVVFKFHLKTGFVRLKDSGIADVLLGGEGLSVRHLSLFMFDTEALSFFSKNFRRLLSYTP